MRRSGYGGYRGRKTGRDVLKYLIVGLVVIIAVLAGILFFGGENQPEAELESPVISDPEQSEVTQEEVPAEPEPQPEPKPEPAPFVMRAMGVEIGQVLDGTWQNVLTECEGNAVVVNMKPDDGSLNWDSGKSVQESEINAKLRQMNGAVYSVARVSCFRDEQLANTYEYCIHSNSGYRWKDFGGIHWVSPASTQVQDRMIAQVVELAELGFQEILLDNCGYPQDGSGEMGWIKRGEVYDPEHLDLVIGSFLSKLRQALAPYEIKVSVRTNPAVVQDAAGAKTGLTGAVLEEYANRIWLSEVEYDEPLAEILSLSGVTEVGARLVTETSILVPENQWEQAVLPF